MKKLIECPTCYGDGVDGYPPDVFECGQCNGKGVVDENGDAVAIDDILVNATARSADGKS